MKCPECGEKFKVKDVVYNSNDKEVYRKRVCSNCKKEIYTTEFEVDPDMDYMELWYSNHRYRKPRNNIPGQITLSDF